MLGVKPVFFLESKWNKVHGTSIWEGGINFQVFGLTQVGQASSTT